MKQITIEENIIVVFEHFFYANRNACEFRVDAAGVMFHTTYVTGLKIVFVISLEIFGCVSLSTKEPSIKDFCFIILLFL